jgi:cell division protease FtsH
MMKKTILYILNLLILISCATAPLEISDNDAKLRMIGGKEALLNAIEYPEYALNKGIEGIVTILAYVDTSGSVLECKIIGGSEFLNEAAILTVRRRKIAITMDELREAIEKVILGPERKSNVVTEREQEITAYHEAGHALVATILPKADNVQKVSIIARGRAAGYTLNAPKSDERLYFKSYFMDQIAVLLAGYATERKIYGEVTSGASNDLKRATDLARKIVTKFGMSKLGPITYGASHEQVFLGKEFHDQSEYSQKMAEKIDAEVEIIIAEALKISTDTINKNEKILEKITKELMEKETIEKERFDEIVGKVFKKKKKKEKVR